MGVLTREKVRVVDVEIVPRRDIAAQRPERQRPAEVWVTPFDEIFGTPDANGAAATEDPAIPVLEVGPVTVPVPVSVEVQADREAEKGFEPLEAQSLSTATPAVEDEVIAEADVDDVDAAFDEAFTDEEEVELAYEDPYVYEDDAAYEEDAELEPVVDTNTCNIAVWRGYRKASFYAQTVDANGNPVALAESPEFKYRGNGTPDKTEAAAQAHEALLALLRENGWEPVERDSTWFGVTFART